MRLIITTVIASCWMISSAANAEIYKCRAADGAISYSQMECTVDAASAQVVKVFARPKSADVPKPAQPRHTVPQYDHPEFAEGHYGGPENR